MALVRWGRSGPWRVMARLDHPDASEANAQALDDLAGGADGLAVVFAGAIGAHGFGLRKFDPATLHAAFDGVRFDGGTRFRARPRAGRPARGAELRRADRAIGRPSARLRRVVRARSLRRRGERPVPGRLGVPGEALSRRGACRCAPEATPDPFSSRTRRSVHAAGGTPGQELGFRALRRASLSCAGSKPCAFRWTRRAA